MAKNIEDNLKKSEEIRNECKRLVKESKKLPIDSEERGDKLWEAFNYMFCSLSYKTNALGNYLGEGLTKSLKELEDKKIKEGYIKK